MSIARNTRKTLHSFQFASNGNEEAVEKLLSSTDEPGSSGEKFCHPLCSCEKCEKLHTRYGPFTTLQLVFNKARSNRRKILAVATQLKQLRKECLKKKLFLRLSFRNCLSCVVTARIFLLFDLSSAVQNICFIYLHLLIHPLRVYYELTVSPAPSWLDSSVGRALHPHRRGHGFESCSSLSFFFFFFFFFFRHSFRNCLSCVVTARIFLLFDLSSVVQIYVSYIYVYLFILHGYITNSQYDQLPVGLIAQLVEHYTGIAEVMGSNPLQA